MTTATASSRLRTRDLTYIALFAVLMAVCAFLFVLDIKVKKIQITALFKR